MNSSLSTFISLQPFGVAPTLTHSNYFVSHENRRDVGVGVGEVDSVRTSMRKRSLSEKEAQRRLLMRSRFVRIVSSWPSIASVVTCARQRTRSRVSLWFLWLLCTVNTSVFVCVRVLWPANSSPARADAPAAGRSWRSGAARRPAARARAAARLRTHTNRHPRSRAQSEQRSSYRCALVSSSVQYSEAVPSVAACARIAC